MNARILELGSGAGFLGITIAQMQLDLAAKKEITSFSLYLTDMSEQVLDRCRHNVELECSELSSKGQWLERYGSDYVKMG